MQSRVSISELAITREEKVTIQAVVKEEEQQRSDRQCGLLRREAAGLNLSRVSRTEQDSSMGEIVFSW